MERVGMGTSPRFSPWPMTFTPSETTLSSRTDSSGDFGTLNSIRARDMSCSSSRAVSVADSRKHTKLIATHRATGLQVAVEAKSRHRPGVLGFKGPPSLRAPAVAEHRARMRGLLVDALKKEPGRPFVVFLDVNLPGSDGPAEAPSWIREIEEKTLPRLSRTERERMNLAIFTSIPFHYASPDGPIPSSIVTAHQPNHPPTFPIGQEVLESLIEATRLFMNVPRQFPASGSFNRGAGSL